MRLLQLVPLRLELGGHAVERVDQAAQLVGRAHRDPRVEVAAGDVARRARQLADRIGNALGHRQADAGAEQDEHQRGELQAAIEIVDLALHFVLAERQRHRQYRVARSGPDRRRGEHVGHVADAVLGDDAGQALQHDGAVDRLRRARRQQTRREEVAFAGRRQHRAVEDVDVLVDQLADPHHQIVAEGDHAFGARELLGVLDDALRHRRGPRRLALDVGQQQPGEVGTDEEGERQHRHDRGEHEGQEQLAVEAGADFAQQRSAGLRTAARQPREQRVGEQQHDVDGGRQRRQLRETDEVVEDARHRVAERVDEQPIVGEIDVIRPAVLLGNRPERLARLVDAIEGGGSELP